MIMAAPAFVANVFESKMPARSLAEWLRPPGTSVRTSWPSAPSAGGVVHLVGNDRLKVLPVWEMTFGSLPHSLPAIATRKVKWDRGYQKKYGITTAAAAELPEGTRVQIRIRDRS